MDTLIVTVSRSCHLHAWSGSRSGIAMARTQAVSAAITPVLDVMQTMPSFAYLAAVRADLRHRRRLRGRAARSSTPCRRWSGSPSTASASVSDDHRSRRPARSGVTTGQLLRQVQLPMARRTIVVGINQCTMAALSMATIAAFVNGPGLGTDVDRGAAEPRTSVRPRSPGLLIVLIAIMLDRTTTAASERRARSRAASVSGWA